MLTPDEIKIFSLCAPHLPGYPVVFDVGAYKGRYTDMVLAIFPIVQYYLFEPNESLCIELKKYRAPHRVYNIALSQAKGGLPFYRCIGKADELSSTYKREIFSEVEHVEESKPCTSVDIFCKENDIHRIDFLKIDVEGAEFDVLKGSEEMLRKNFIKFIQVEYGGTYKDSGITFIDVIKFAYSFGYWIYELIENKLVKVKATTFIEDYRFTNFLITCHDFK